MGLCKSPLLICVWCSCNYKCGRNHVLEVRSLESVNSSGCLRVDLFNRKTYEASSKSTTIEESEYEKRDHLLEEHKGFYRTILDPSIPPKVSIDDGIQAVYFVEMVLKSLEQGKTLEC